MATPTIPKGSGVPDVNFDLDPDKDISGDSIEAGLLPKNVDTSKKPSAMLTEDALVNWSTADGNVTITDGSAGEGTINIVEADLEDITPKHYLMLVRIERTNDVIVPPMPEIEIVLKAQ